jgi:hypothetical protein
MYPAPPIAAVRNSGRRRTTALLPIGVGRQFEAERDHDLRRRGDYPWHARLRGYRGQHAEDFPRRRPGVERSLHLKEIGSGRRVERHQRRDLHQRERIRLQGAVSAKLLAHAHGLTEDP